MGCVCSVRRVQLPFIVYACGCWGGGTGCAFIEVPPTQQTDLWQNLYLVPTRHGTPKRPWAKETFPAHHSSLSGLGLCLLLQGQEWLGILKTILIVWIILYKSTKQRNRGKRCLTNLPAWQINLPLSVMSSVCIYLQTQFSHGYCHNVDRILYSICFFQYSTTAT